MNKPFQPRDGVCTATRFGYSHCVGKCQDSTECRATPLPARDPWGNTDNDYRAALERVRAAVRELNALYREQMQSGEYRPPSRFMLEPLTETQQRNANAQFDNARERDEQGLTVGEKL